jgi:hypothetical protein
MFGSAVKAAQSDNVRNLDFGLLSSVCIWAYGNLRVWLVVLPSYNLDGRGIDSVFEQRTGNRQKEIEIVGQAHVLEEGNKILL